MPGYANPQNLNRYSYVINNPLRYTDPTGHSYSDGCKDYGCDFGTSGPTSGGNTTVPTSDPDNDDEPDTPQDPPLEYDDDLSYGFHTGPINDYYAVDFNGDLPAELTGPNICYGSRSRSSLCILSMLLSFPMSYGSSDLENNFWVNLSVQFSESAGVIRTSNISVSNAYSGLLFLKSVSISSGGMNHTAYATQSHHPMSSGFGSTAIPDTGGVFNSNNRVAITVKLEYVVNIGNGPFTVPQKLNIVLPSLNELP